MPDIKKINGRYYDFSRDRFAGTYRQKNGSFLQTAYELKTLGVQNYYEMLEIKNPKVADIDPYKPNITSQEVQALMQEYQQNMWFFMRTTSKLRTQAGIRDLELHRGLYAASWCFIHGYDHLLCEPRQTFKTTGMIAGPFLWAFQIGTQDAHFKFMGKSHDNTKDNLAHLKDDIGLLPEWLRFDKYLDNQNKVKKQRQAAETIRNMLAQNFATATPEAASHAKAMSIARGKSAPLILWDEFEFTPFMDVILANSGPIFITASQNARAAGRPAVRSMLTTPGDLDTREGARADPIIKSMPPWTEKIYDWTPQQIQAYRDTFREEYHANEENDDTRETVDIFYIEYTHTQVRKDESWVQAQYKATGDRMTIRREIFLQRLRGSSQSPIDAADIEYLISNMKKSQKDLLILDKYRFLLYEHGQSLLGGQLRDLDPEIPYIVGVDPAAGGGGDNSAICIMNPYNLKVAAEFRHKYVPGTEIIKILVELVYNYIPKCCIIIEKNNMGIFLLQSIIDNTDIRANLYWSESARQLDQMTEESEADYQLRVAAEAYRKYGTYVNVKVRKAMFELLFQHIAEARHILNTEYLVDDICKLTKTSTGRIEAIKGKHDDSLFAWFHCVYIFYTGDNLGIFGIDRDKALAFGQVTVSEENRVLTHDNLQEYFSTENVTFEQIYIESAVRTEEQIKYMVNNNPNIHDMIYSKLRDSGKDDPNKLHDISPFLFDTFNGTLEDEYYISEPGSLKLY